jgi:hypothetical protein
LSSGLPDDVTGDAGSEGVAAPMLRRRSRMGMNFARIVVILVLFLVLLLAWGLLVVLSAILLPGLPQSADAGELQLVTHELGIAHPPGYPLYTLVMYGLGRTLFVTSSWVLSLAIIHVVLAVGTLFLVFMAGRLLGQSNWAGLAAAATLGLAPTFLAQTVVTNIRMPAAFLAALTLWLTLRWLAVESPIRGRWKVDWGFAAVAFAFGLAVGHHLSLAGLALPIGAAIVLRRPSVVRDGRTLAAAVGALAISQLPVLYLPLRDQPGTLFAPGTLRTARGLWEWVTAAGFRGDMLYFQDVTTALDRVAVLWNILLLQFGPLLLVAAAVGALVLAKRDQPAAVLLIGSAAMVIVATMTYRAPQTMEYLLPAYVAIALLIGAAAGALAIVRPPLGAGLVALALLGLLADRGQLPQAADRAQQQMRLAPEIAALNCAPQGATILASWHDAMPLLYAQRHSWMITDDMGFVPDTTRRPDVHIQYVYPEGAEPIGETWRRQLAETRGPVIVTNRSREMLDAGVALWPMPFTPFYAAQVADPCFNEAPDNRFVDHVFGGRIRLTRIRAEWNRIPPSDQTGGMPYLLDFEALQPITETLTVVAQLIDPNTGEVWGQADQSVPAARWNTPGGVGLRVDLTPFRGDLPRVLRLHVGVYRSTADGSRRLLVDGTESVDLGSIDERGERLRHLAMPAPAPNEIPFGRAMTLVDHRTHRDGDELVVDLTWRADPWASRSDYTVSVQAHGDTWTAQDDGTPALGAIPTLKWLPGMVIRDRHRIQLPADLPEDAPYRVTVGVYDAFSLEPLPVTDGERVRQGQGQAVEIDRR